MKVYFRNLDGIRFFAALLVVLRHSFEFQRNYSIGNPWVIRCFDYAGVAGVNLFFILSGFLISYLLLVEKDKTGTVSYKNFYIRRILRIWPLYLGYGLVLDFLSPHVAEWLGLGNNTDVPTMFLNLVFLLLFAVNVQMAFLGDNRGMFEISWSVCVEEQFYLIWPVVINNFRKRLARVLVILALISIAARLFFCFLLPSLYSSWTPVRAWDANYVLIFEKLDLFGGGLIIALLYYRRDRYEALFKRLFHPLVQWVVLILGLLHTTSLIRFSNDMVNLFLDHPVCIALFGYTLLAAVRDNSILRLETPLLKTLGKVSYGIYLFHMAICQLVLIAFKKFIGHPESHILYAVVYPLCNTVLTCIVAYLSYTFFEKRFLNMKDRFALVHTRI